MYQLQGHFNTAPPACQWVEIVLFCGNPAAPQQLIHSDVKEVRNGYQCLHGGPALPRS